MAIMEDDKILLNKYMPIIRGINLYLNRKPCKSLIGGNHVQMSLSMFESISVGQIYRTHHYVSCQMLKKNDKKILETNTTLIIYFIDKECWNGKDISQHSAYPEHKEILLPPYTSLQVAKKVMTMSGQEIHVNVLDNLRVEADEKNGKNSYLCTWLMPKLDQEENNKNDEISNIVDDDNNRKKSFQQHNMKNDHKEDIQICIEQLKIKMFKPLCICGNILVFVNWYYCYGGSEVSCNICKHVIKQDVYHCNSCVEDNSYDECISCAKVQPKNYQ